MGSDPSSTLTLNTGFPISIHAPAWGATTGCYKGNISGLRFQSTLPRGERLAYNSLSPGYISISIHAPAWGATYAGAGSQAFPSVFQSTLPRGERHARRGTMTPAEYKFQSTLPRGERLHNRHYSIKYSQFQSTLPRGERHI